MHKASSRKAPWRVALSRAALAWFLLLPTSLVGLCCQQDLRPFFEETFLLQTTLGAGFYHALVSKTHLTRRPIWIGCGISPYPRFDLQARLGLMDISDERTYFDYGSLRVRYLLFSQDVGDPLHMVAGATALFATQRAVHDMAAEHLGPVEGIFHLSIGHEIQHNNVPVWQLWTVGGCAVSERGGPQLRGQLGISRCFAHCSSLTLLLSGLLGLGKDPLKAQHFNGYGQVRTRALEIAGGYRLEWEGHLYASLCYSYRLFAKNYPKRRHCVCLTITLPLFP